MFSHHIQRLHHGLHPGTHARRDGQRPGPLPHGHGAVGGHHLHPLGGGRAPFWRRFPIATAESASSSSGCWGSRCPASQPRSRTVILTVAVLRFFAGLKRRPGATHRRWRLSGTTFTGRARGLGHRVRNGGRGHGPARRKSRGVAFLTDHLGWRNALWITGLFGLTLSLYTLRSLPRREADRRAVFLSGQLHVDAPGRLVAPDERQRHRAAHDFHLF